jgi:GrpB-like predicted nucleotidyltransferase (UPF0157 family)
MNEPAIIADYDPRWPERFEALRSTIAAAIGLAAASIEHIGSTAVPGLAAKPIIDIDILLRSDAEFLRVVACLGRIGYHHRGDLGISGREAFQAPPGSVPHHLYVCLPDCKEYRRHLALRDHLRTHPQEARAYADLKRRLAAELGSDREAYTQAKTEFIEETLRGLSVDPDHGTFSLHKRTIP